MIEKYHKIESSMVDHLNSNKRKILIGARSLFGGRLFRFWQLLTFTVVAVTTYGAEELKFRHLALEQGLSHNSVYSIIQDTHGYTSSKGRVGPNKPSLTLQMKPNANTMQRS